MSSRHSADVFVCESVVKPQLRTQLAASMKGGSLVDSGFMLRGEGPVIKLKRLMRTPHWIQISPAFVQDFGGLAMTIRKVISTQRTPKMWRLISLDEMKVRSSTTRPRVVSHAP